MQNSKQKTRFEELYRKYNGLLYGYAYTILHSHALAEDAVQDCFMRAFSSLDLSRKEGEIKTWLFVTLRNLSIDCLRRECRNVGEDPLMFVPSQEDSRMEEKSLLNDVMNALSPEDQQLMVLSAAGFRQREIAEKLGMPIGTVSWRFGEMKKKLRAFSRS